MSASTRKMPEPIMEPATIAVELNSPSVCTIDGAAWVLTAEFSTEVSSGVCTALVLSEFKTIVLRNFWRGARESDWRRLSKLPDPLAERYRRVRGMENCLRHGDHACA